MLNTGINFSVFDLEEYVNKLSGKRGKKKDMGPRVCPQCGQPAGVEARFCAYCGTKLTGTTGTSGGIYDPAEAAEQGNGSFHPMTTVLFDGKEGGTTVLGTEDFEAPIYPYLIRSKNQEKISVDKEVFRIGKEREYCDYFVSDNNAVSRNHADIIASTYFLITRYEEIIQRNVRDEHGRFPGKNSLPYRAGFLHRPIVDEYRILLRKWLRQYGLRIPEIPKEIQHIYLTHDLDSPTLYRTWKGVIRSIRDKRGIIQSIQGKCGPVENDPYYTFPWIFEQNNLLREQTGKNICRAILFVRSGGKCKQDKPHYSLRNTDISQLIQSALSNDITIGLHSSYQAGIVPTLIKKEKTWLEKNVERSIRFNRHHFLASREPEDMTHLEAAGITDDFTMGYADVAGFRLGTSYPVRWINPVTRRLSSILLHPLTIMDCTLEEKKYMGLNYEEALAYSLNLIEQVKNTGGELTLLWHNTSAQENTDSYLRKLYSHLLNELAKK